MRHDRKGFTLIELIIVIVIIGVLMAVAVPILSGAKTKAICAEAATGIGTLRTAFRNYYSEYQRYPDIPSPYAPGTYRWLTTDPPNPLRTVNANTLDALGLTGGVLGSFNGRYFSNNCYLFGSNGTTLYIYVFTDPTLFSGQGGTANTSQGGQSGETQAIVDLPRTGASNYGLIYVNDTSTSKGRIRQYKISRSGF